ncbi:hypothetical protein CR513_20411, partial [Mucuna pruriens]
MKVNSAEESNSKADTFAETDSATADQTQAKVEFSVPSGSDSEGALEAKADSPDQVGQSDPTSETDKSPSPSPPIELKTLPSHLKYAYLNKDQQLPYFYEGLSMMDRSMIDAASRGDLMDKTPATTKHLISNIASNTQ